MQHLWCVSRSVWTWIARWSLWYTPVCTARWSLWCRWKKSSYDNRAGWSRELSHWLLLLIIALQVCDCVWLTLLQSYLWRFYVSVLMAISLKYLDLGPSLYYIHFNIPFRTESGVPADFFSTHCTKLHCGQVPPGCGQVSPGSYWLGVLAVTKQMTLNHWRKLISMTTALHTAAGCIMCNIFWLNLRFLTQQTYNVGGLLELVIMIYFNLPYFIMLLLVCPI